ncbi:hypothetical protein ACKFKH_32095, partial [Phormidesmis sp. 146-20]
PPQVRDFEREILSQSPPILGGWGAEVLTNEVRKLHRIHVGLALSRFWLNPVEGYARVINSFP